MTKRSKAYRAAANTGGERAVGVLVARLGDGDLLQRDSLTTALATVGEPAVPALVAALSSDDAVVREHAAETLGHLGGPEADAARTLGWSEVRIFSRLMMPLAWPSIAAGTVLAFARAMGEFGAVAVVSGKIRGETATMPITIEMLYNEYLSVAAFSMAAALTALATGPSRSLMARSTLRALLKLGCLRLRVT